MTSGDGIRGGVGGAERGSVGGALGGAGLTASDFVEAVPATLTIADGETTASVTLTVADDAAVEGTETASFTIANPTAGLVLGAVTSGTFADNEIGIGRRGRMTWPSPAVTLSVVPGAGFGDGGDGGGPVTSGDGNPRRCRGRRAWILRLAARGSRRRTLWRRFRRC